MSVHDGLLDVAWFCVCKLGGSLAGKECKLGGGGWCECEWVGRQKGLCGSCLIRVTSMHCIKSIRMFEDDGTSPEHAIVIQGGSLGGLGWWSDVCNLKIVLPSLGCLSILIRVLALSFLAL